MTPGIHFDVRAKDYHADAFGDVPTLSSSIAKVLLSHTPRHAWTAHPRLNPRFEADDDSKFDLGSAAHEIILGRGSGIDVHDFADWRSKDAKAARDASRVAGRTPMLSHQRDRALEIAEAAWRHPHAPYAEDHAETVVVWDDIGGARCRAMIDHWDGQTLITDTKTTEVALTDNSIARQIVNLGYDLSAAFYMRGIVRHRPELAGRLRFFWHFIETSAPFGNRIVEADPLTLTIGDRKAALAIAKWKRCLEANDWPAWSTKIGRVEMPVWFESQQMERELVDDDFKQAVVSNTLVPHTTRKLMGPV